MAEDSSNECCHYSSITELRRAHHLSVLYPPLQKGGSGGFPGGWLHSKLLINLLARRGLKPRRYRFAQSQDTGR